MIKITKSAPNRVDIKISGPIDADVMQEGLDRLIADSEGVTKGRMLYTIEDFELPTIGALGVEFARLPKLFELLDKFDRCAVLTDAAWLRTAAEVEGAFFPGVDIKSFRMSQKEAAEHWLAEDVPVEMDPTENLPV